MSLIGKEVIADGNWRPSGTSGFIGDIKRKKKTARGYCKVKPEPGSKLVFRCIIHKAGRPYQAGEYTDHNREQVTYEEWKG
jgi:hypothetical protein